MNRGCNVLLSLLVGFCGGNFAQYLLPQLAHAQRPQQAERTISAQKFILVNDHGAQAGIFGFDKNGSPEITLLDSLGNVIWSTQLRAIPITH